MQALGAIPYGPDRVEFRVWAPDADSVSVRVREREHGLERADDGTWSADVPAQAGDDYVYRLGDERALPDPCSRFQPEGVRGPSRVVDTSRFDIASRTGTKLEE